MASEANGHVENGVSHPQVLRRAAESFATKATETTNFLKSSQSVPGPVKSGITFVEAKIKDVSERYPQVTAYGSTIITSVDDKLGSVVKPVEKVIESARSYERTVRHDVPDRVLNYVSSSLDTYIPPAVDAEKFAQAPGEAAIIGRSVDIATKTAVRAQRTTASQLAVVKEYAEKKVKDSPAVVQTIVRHAESGIKYAFGVAQFVVMSWVLVLSTAWQKTKSVTTVAKDTVESQAAKATAVAKETNGTVALTAQSAGKAAYSTFVGFAPVVLDKVESTIALVLPLEASTLSHESATGAFPEAKAIGYRALDLAKRTTDAAVIKIRQLLGSSAPATPAASS